MISPPRVVASVGPFDLLHTMVGSSRYWYVKHRPTDKYAAMFDKAPCLGRVKDVKAKFLAVTAEWPDMAAWDPFKATLDEIKRVRGLMTMFERADATSYRLAP